MLKVSFDLIQTWQMYLTLNQGSGNFQSDTKSTVLVHNKSVFWKKIVKSRIVTRFTVTKSTFDCMFYTIRFHFGIFNFNILVLFSNYGLIFNFCFQITISMTLWTCKSFQLVIRKVFNKCFIKGFRKWHLENWINKCTL